MSDMLGDGRRRARRALAVALGLALLAGALPAGLTAAPPGQAGPGYEVWVVDQADSAEGGARLYIWRGVQLAGATPTGGPEVLDLAAAATGVGDGPGVRPHLLLFNNTHSHGILANVGSGHVQFIRGSDRRVVASIDVGEQAHGAVPAPDDSHVLAANQNGKRLARIRSDFGREQFTYEPQADLDLGALEDAEHPDNAPICPLIYTGANKAYVTVRGGGLYVVDTAATPMRVTRQYGKSDIAPAGCGGVALGDKVYINSGTATTSDLYVLDARTDDIVKHVALSGVGGDAHGMVLTGNGGYLWMSLRANGNVVVLDTANDEIETIFTIGSGQGRRPSVPGAAPDLMDVAPGPGRALDCQPSSTPMCLAPGGDRVFVSMRGPRALTGGMGAAGDRTGLEILRVEDDGRFGARQAFIPIGEDLSDVHAMAVRVLSTAAR
jgi:DNA-binding beta-propeller fold protein YncE